MHGAALKVSPPPLDVSINRKLKIPGSSQIPSFKLHIASNFPGANRIFTNLRSSSNHHSFSLFLQLLRHCWYRKLTELPLSRCGHLAFCSPSWRLCRSPWLMCPSLSPLLVHQFPAGHQLLSLGPILPLHHRFQNSRRTNYFFTVARIPPLSSYILWAKALSPRATPLPQRSRLGLEEQARMHSMSVVFPNLVIYSSAITAFWA